MSSTHPLTLDIHGVSVRLEGDAEAVDRLGIHFGAFLGADTRSTPALRITLDRGEPTLRLGTRRRADQVLDRGIVYNEGGQTIIDHHGYAISTYDFLRDRGTVQARTVEDLVELGYLMVHSRIGTHLERRGLFRIHGVGVAIGENAALVLAPSGGGKSTLARAVLRSTSASLLGDDMVLIDRSGRVRPFHTPIGLTDPSEAEGIGAPLSFARRHHPPKWIVPLESLGSRLATGSHQASLIALGTRVSAGPSRLAEAPRAAMGEALWRDMVVGLGLPQVLELVARRGARDLLGLAPLAARRSARAFKLLSRAEGVILEMADPEEAAHLLVERLRYSAGTGSKRSA